MGTRPKEIRCGKGRTIARENPFIPMKPYWDIATIKFFHKVPVHWKWFRRVGWYSRVTQTKMIKGLKHLSYEKRLGHLGLFRLGKKQLKWVLINVYKYVKGGCPEDGCTFFSVVLSNKTRGSGGSSRNWCSGSSTWTRGRASLQCSDCGLEQVVQTECGIFLTGDILELSGFNPVLCAWVTLLEQGDWARWTTGVPSNPTHSVLFYSIHMTYSIILWIMKNWKKVQNS